MTKLDHVATEGKPFSFGLMPFDFFQNAMYLAMLEEAESGNAGDATGQGIFKQQTEEVGVFRFGFAFF